MYFIYFVFLLENRHKEKSKFVCAQHLSLWKGDLNETLKEAIEKNAVTPWLISLAPMVSPKSVTCIYIIKIFICLFLDCGQQPASVTQKN